MTQFIAITSHNFRLSPDIKGENAFLRSAEPPHGACSAGSWCGPGMAQAPPGAERLGPTAWRPGPPPPPHLGAGSRVLIRSSLSHHRPTHLAGNPQVSLCSRFCARSDWPRATGHLQVTWVQNVALPKSHRTWPLSSFPHIILLLNLVRGTLSTGTLVS